MKSFYNRFKYKHTLATNARVETNTLENNHLSTKSQIWWRRGRVVGMWDEASFHGGNDAMYDFIV